MVKSKLKRDLMTTKRGKNHPHFSNSVHVNEDVIQIFYFLLSMPKGTMEEQLQQSHSKKTPGVMVMEDPTAVGVAFKQKLFIHPFTF